MRTRPNSIRIGILLFGVALMALSCVDYRRETVIPESVHESEYSFEPGTIQAAIEAGQRNAFQLVWERGFRTDVPATLHLPTSAPDYPPVAWGEADFERVVQASADFLGKEPMAGLRLSAIWFRLPCSYATIGPQWMRFFYFKVLQSPAEEGDTEFTLYSERAATVDAEVGRLGWDESEELIFYEEEALDRSGAYIPAEAALRIAESVGGSNVRAEVDNACIVYGDIIAGRADSEWRIRYVSDKRPFTRLLEVQVDKETGVGVILATPKP